MYIREEESLNILASSITLPHYTTLQYHNTTHSVITPKHLAQTTNPEIPSCKPNQPVSAAPTASHSPENHSSRCACLTPLLSYPSNKPPPVPLPLHRRTPPNRQRLQQQLDTTDDRLEGSIRHAQNLLSTCRKRQHDHFSPLRGLRQLALSDLGWISRAHGH